ncbi:MULTISPECIES: Vms1/Ankzf1 family peptidyl-tRNA hydrolase [unclassified Kitasatospora]|uniref:baeRF2 domain-containing protein n=1 Tax=unclassified Kitasatospora TaxID=2633591 RepID=UPI0033C2E23C
MTTGTETGTAALRELLAASGPFLSVYFDLDPRPEMGLDAEQRWQGLCRDLAAQGATVDDLAALTRRFLSSQPGSGVLAAFAAGGEVVHSAVLPGCEQTDLARLAPLPHLLPLLAWRQDHPAHVVAVVDRTGADLQLYPTGATEGMRRTVTGPDDEIERNQPGGTSQMRYQHRAEDSWEHNAVTVVKALGTALAKVDAHVLMLAGDVRARQYLTKHLPTWVRHEVEIHPVSGSRSPDGAWPQRAVQVDAETHKAGQKETAALLHAYGEQLSPRGHAVEGIYATLRALADGQLRTLLVTDDPASRRTAWFGPEPTDIADASTAFTEHTKGLIRAPLADAAVRAALLTGADVRVLQPGATGAPAQGIGGLTRYTHIQP